MSRPAANAQNLNQTLSTIRAALIAAATLRVTEVALSKIAMDTMNNGSTDAEASLDGSEWPPSRDSRFSINYRVPGAGH